MLDMRHTSKIKNDKILRWRLELAAFDFTIIYRPGKLNFAPDTLSRAISASVSFPSLKSLTNLYESLCHPGIIRLAHYVKVFLCQMLTMSKLAVFVKRCQKCYTSLQRLQQSKSFFPETSRHNELNKGNPAF